MVRSKGYMFGPDAKVLILLLQHGRINRSAFQSKYGMNYDSAVNSLQLFKNHGITDFEERGDFKDTQTWFLTEKGKIAAQKLSELVAFIETE